MAAASQCWLLDTCPIVYVTCCGYVSRCRGRGKIIEPPSRSRPALKTAPVRDTSTPPGAQNLAQKPPESQNPAQKPPRAQNINRNGCNSQELRQKLCFNKPYVNSLNSISHGNTCKISRDRCNSQKFQQKLCFNKPYVNSVNSISHGNTCTIKIAAIRRNSNKNSALTNTM